MIELNGIVYANDPRPELIRVQYVKPLEDYRLFLTFNNGKQKIYDMSDCLDNGVFKQLQDVNIFNQAYVSCGTVAWSDDLDIDPDTLYMNGVPADYNQKIV